MTETGTESGKAHNMKVREFQDLSRKHKYTLIRLMFQELWSLKIGRGVSSEQIELSGQLWTLSSLSSENWGNLEYQNPR
jgi:hypothetical protein